VLAQYFISGNFVYCGYLEHIYDAMVSVLASVAADSWFEVLFLCYKYSIKKQEQRLVVPESE
jgi:hypothetical protein